MSIEQTNAAAATSQQGSSSLHRRVLSFGKRKPRVAKENASDQSTPEMQKRSLSFGRRPRRMSIGGSDAIITRVSSFGRKMKKQPSPSSLAACVSLREVSLYKPTRDDALGLTLKERLQGQGQGETLVAQIAKGSIASKSKQMVAGDSIVAINGVAVTDFHQASELLRAAHGVVQLVVSAAPPLPAGWTAHVDKSGETYYTHAELLLRSVYHPASVSIPDEHAASADPESPRKSPRNGQSRDATGRWRSAFHTVSVVNRLNGEIDHEDVTHASLEPIHNHGLALQRERV